ncbi:MAG: ABC transporter ATP-binding protein [Desulfurobacteriaceae bacterium]
MEILRVDGLTVRFGGKTVIEDLNFSILSGEKTFIVGPNGAGKTTLIETIMGFIKPVFGKIYLFGKEVRTEEDFFRVRTTVGYVFQNPDDQLFSPTVEEELAFGPLNLGLSREEVGRRINKVVKELGIENLREKFTYKLSGGEKRIVSIASVLTMDPQVLILDEPSNGLDEEKFLYLVDFLKKTEKAIVVITHDKELVKKLAWKTYKMENGKLIPLLRVL